MNHQSRRLETAVSENCGCGVHTMSSGPTRGLAGITGGAGPGETPESNGAEAPSLHALDGGMSAEEAHCGISAVVELPSRQNGGLTAGAVDGGDLAVEEPAVAAGPMAASRPRPRDGCAPLADGDVTVGPMVEADARRVAAAQDGAHEEAAAGAQAASDVRAAAGAQAVAESVRAVAAAGT